MERKMEQDALRKLKRRRHWRLWQKLVSVMMCLVVFCTTYALILPAITQETDTFCGLEEHVHTGKCYQQQENLICEFAEAELHVHTEECQSLTEISPACGQEETEGHSHSDTCVPLDEKLLVCALEETEGHAHTEACQPVENKNLVCTLAETEGHAHSEACQPCEETIVTCTLAEVGGHVHTDACQPVENKNLVCTLAEAAGHVHTEACQPVENKNLICTVPVSEGHSHTAACSETITQLVCTMAEIEAHAHGDGCYTPSLTCILTEDETHLHDSGCYTPFLTCTKPETAGHAHGSACYGETSVNICALAETQAHSHTDACYMVSLSYGCGLEAAEGHYHTDACYTVSTAYGCGLEATEGHTHSDACRTLITVYGCGLEAAEGHSHTDACYAVTTVYGCGLEAAEAHAHADTCYEQAYSCGQRETEGHAHDESCYPTVYSCGLEETDHVHQDECYGPSPALICTLTEDGTHTHGEECFNCPPLCQLEEHEHELQCYSNPNADLETAASWEATLPGNLTGNYAEDLLAVAKSQLGYTESTRNYLVDEAGEVKGYNRYGAWYGYPYGDWCAMFVSFCLNYAQVEGIPQGHYCPDWVMALQNEGLYVPAGAYNPKAGDIIFFDLNWDANPDHVGIVVEYFPADEYNVARIQTIEGNSADMVRYNTYNQADPSIMGYGILPGAQEEETEKHGFVIPRGVGAWAVLVDSNGLVQIPEESSTYGLRRMEASTWNMTRAAATLDLTPYINEVNMYDADGNLIESGSVVTEGDLIQFAISYTITGQQLGVMNGQNVTVNADTVTYDLPDILQVIQNDSGNIVNSAGMTVGTYLIDSESGTINMTFSSGYVKENAKGVQIQGNISFYSTVKKITEEDGEEQDYKFTDDITLGVIIEENKENVGDLSIEKKKLSVEGEELVYELTVTSANGTKGPITITDRMSEGLSFVEGLGAWKGDNRLPNASFAVSPDERSFTMQLPEMAAGDVYTVRYRCEADIKDLDAEMLVSNTATVKGKNNQDVDLEDESTVNHTFDVLKKTGMLNEDGSITWTITVNQAKADISGWVLDDIIGADGNTNRYNGTVNITDSSGNVLATTKLPYTFPDGSTDTYEISYTTLHGYDNSGSITNQAILKYDDTTITEDSKVGIGSPLTKYGEAGEVFEDENGVNKLPISWTVTIDTTNGPILGGETLIDKMHGYPSDDMYMTYAQLMAAYENINAKVMEASGQGLAGFVAYEFVSGDERYGQAHDYNELAAGGACESLLYERFEAKLGSAGIPQGKQVTFTYDTYGVFDNNVISLSHFVNRFNISERYEVSHTVLYGGGYVSSKKLNMQYYDPDVYQNLWDIYDYGAGDAKPNSPNVGTTYLEYEKLHDSYLGWGIELLVPPHYLGSGDIVLYEDMPDGVTVRALDLSFLNLPQMDNPMIQVAPGNTYEWTFTLYTAQEYINNYFPGPGTKMFIKVEVSESGDLKLTIPGEVFSTISEYIPLYNELSWVTPDRRLKESWGYLNIYAQINDDFDWQPQSEGSSVYVNTFKNTFSLYDEYGNFLDEGQINQHITKDESEGVIRKKAETDNNNIINYSVVLNAYGRDLVKNSGILSIHDELTYTSTDGQLLRLRLVPGSVKLYEIDLASDGSYTKKGELTPSYHYAENSSVLNGVTTWVHTIDMNVPDSKSLVLEYAYKASGVENIKHDVLNTCTINGVGQGGLDGDYKVEIEVKKAAAQADTKGVMIYKVDANSDGLCLENAVFNIYIWNAEQNAYIPVHHPDNGDPDFVTDSNGMIVLDSATMGERQFAYNTAYYIVEKEAPEGYYVSPDEYYFQIVNSDKVAYPPCIPEGFNGHALTSGDIIYRQNVRAGYTLPETGGTGNERYTMAGLLLMLTSAAYLMYNKKPHRREEL